MIYLDFTKDCPNCGPGTIHYLNGEMVPHGCDYVPPSLIIDCRGTQEEDQCERRWGKQ